MFVEDFRSEFYNVLTGKRILIMVNYDIDGICASKILQSLFKYDNMLYSLMPVMGLASLQRAYEENRKDVKYVILINCGGCVDIVELLQPEDDVVFFVCDSHRPLDVCNIYSDKQICILRSSTDVEDDIPNFESIFRESDDEESGQSNSEEEEVDEATRIHRRATKRRERQRWEEERDRLMFNYTQYSFYGRSSALVMFELAWKMSKDCTDLLWWAIVGSTEQLLLGKIESSTYALEESAVQGHVSRISSQLLEQSNQVSVKISLEKDLSLALYRHWSVHDSIRYSMYTACKLKLWTLRGEKKLHELLVEMGLPLSQAKQMFASMDLVLRREFQQMFEKLAEKYGIPDIVYSSFTLQYGYRNKFSASDYIYSMLALIACNKDRKPEDRFLEAFDSLSRDNRDLLLSGIEKSKKLLAVIFKQVQSSLEMNQVHVAGSFLYYIVSEENMYFAHPYGVLLLGKFILNGYVATSRSRRAADLPLVVSCLVDSQHDLCLLAGIPPVKETSPKNFFGKAFEQAASRSNSSILQDFFETSIIQIRQSDLTKFLDALSVLLG